ncbi:MAG: putative lipoprotein signal peptide [Proteobacteria bacterium]|nr:putative lipoprotein signal peptide [Pseudomonadota bacterium]
MKWISPSSIRRFFVAGGLALAVSMVVAGPKLLHDANGECGGPERHGMPGGELPPPYLSALNLDEAQRDKVFAILHEQAPTMRERLKRLNRAQADLHRLTAGPDYDEAKARALAEPIGRAMSEVALLRARTDRLIFDLLSPEQRKHLAELSPDGERRGIPGAAPRGPGSDGPARPPR